MKDTVMENQFRDAFTQSNNYSNNFSYEGLGELYDYLTELEEDIGEEIELDVIAFCCDYEECTLEEFNNEHDIKFETLEELEKNYEGFIRLVVPHVGFDGIRGESSVIINSNY